MLDAVIAIHRNELSSKCSTSRIPPGPAGWPPHLAIPHSRPVLKDLGSNSVHCLNDCFARTPVVFWFGMTIGKCTVAHLAEHLGNDESSKRACESPFLVAVYVSQASG